MTEFQNRPASLSRRIFFNSIRISKNIAQGNKSTLSFEMFFRFRETTSIQLYNVSAHESFHVTERFVDNQVNKDFRP